MSDDRVRAERPAPGILRLVMNQPERRNPLTRELREALARALEAALADEAVRALVLTGAGGAFSAGGDLASMGELTQGEARARLKAGHRIVRMLALAEKPVVAAIEGPAFGGGAALALLADLVVMGEGARIGFPFFKVGLVPDYGLLHTVPRRVGAGHARRLFLTAATVAAPEALAIGLVDEVVADDAVQAAGLAAAERLAAMPAPAFAMTKQLLAHAPQSLDAALEGEVLAQTLAFATEEHAEGRRAFFEKRAPRFRREANEDTP